MAHYVCQSEEYFCQPCGQAPAGKRLVISHVDPGKKFNLHIKTPVVLRQNLIRFLHFSNLNISLDAESKINSLCVV